MLEKCWHRGRLFPAYSLKTTGSTNYLENGGTLEVAQRIAVHSNRRTTELYDRGQKVLLGDMERMRYLGNSGMNSFLCERTPLWSSTDQGSRLYPKCLC
jgi:hypothetical protein